MFQSAFKNHISLSRRSSCMFSICGKKMVLLYPPGAQQVLHVAVLIAWGWEGFFGIIEVFCVTNAATTTSLPFPPVGFFCLAISESIKTTAYDFGPVNNLSVSAIWFVWGIILLGSTAVKAAYGNRAVATVGAAPGCCCCRWNARALGEEGRPTAPHPPAAAAAGPSVPGSFPSQPRRERTRWGSGRSRTACRTAAALSGSSRPHLLGGRCPWAQQGADDSWPACSCRPPAPQLRGRRRHSALPQPRCMWLLLGVRTLGVKQRGRLKRSDPNFLFSSAVYSNSASAWSVVGPSGLIESRERRDGAEPPVFFSCPFLLLSCWWRQGLLFAFWFSPAVIASSSSNHMHFDHMFEVLAEE